MLFLIMAIMAIRSIYTRLQSLRRQKVHRVTIMWNQVFMLITGPEHMTKRHLNATSVHLMVLLRLLL